MSRRQRCQKDSCLPEAGLAVINMFHVCIGSIYCAIYATLVGLCGNILIFKLYLVRWRYIDFNPGEGGIVPFWEVVINLVHLWHSKLLTLSLTLSHRERGLSLQL